MIIFNTFLFQLAKELRMQPSQLQQPCQGIKTAFKKLSEKVYLNYIQLMANSSFLDFRKGYCFCQHHSETVIQNGPGNIKTKKFCGSNHCESISQDINFCKLFKNSDSTLRQDFEEKCSCVLRPKNIYKPCEKLGIKLPVANKRCRNSRKIWYTKNATKHCYMYTFEIGRCKTLLHPKNVDKTKLDFIRLYHQSGVNSTSDNKSIPVMRKQPPWRIMFFGTDQIAVHTLTALHNNMYVKYDFSITVGIKQ